MRADSGPPVDGNGRVRVETIKRQRVEVIGWHGAPGPDPQQASFLFSNNPRALAVRLRGRAALRTTQSAITRVEK
jgi:hypothetical protein